MKKVMLLVICSLVFFGCTSLKGGDATLKLGVTYATLKTIEGKPAMAEKTCQLAGEAQRIFDFETIPIKEVETLIRERIDFTKLDQADALLVDALIHMIAFELDAWVQEEIANPERYREQRVKASQIMDWIQLVSC